MTACAISMALLMNLATIIVALQHPSSNLEHSVQFQHLLLEINQQRSFYTLFILASDLKDCSFDLEALQLNGTQILQTDMQQKSLKEVGVNSELLVLVCMAVEIQEDILLTLAKQLDGMRQARIIFALKNFSHSTQFINQAIFDFCKAKKMIYVLSLHEDFYTNGSFYELQPFSNVCVEQRSFPDRSSPIFQQILSDMQGQKLLTLPAQIVPRSLFFRNRDGEAEMTGYVGRCVALFAQHYNARLQLLHPVNFGEITHMLLIGNMTRRGLLDLPMSISPLELGQLASASYPVDYQNWYTMVPVASYLSKAELFRVILRRQILILLGFLIVSCSILQAISVFVVNKTKPSMNLNFILNDKVLRAVLGQSFIMSRLPTFAQRVIYSVLFMLGIYFTSLTAAKLNAYLTLPPTEAEIRSFSDLSKKGLRMMVDSNEMALIERTVTPQVWLEMKPLLWPTTSHNFHSTRRSLNSSYAYTIASSLKVIFDHQSEYFQRPTFHYPPSMVLRWTWPHSIPLQRNSILKETLDMFIMRVKQAGLFDYWYWRTFEDMVEAKIIKLEDERDKERLNKATGFQVLDFKWIWLLLSAGWLASLICFAVEWIIIMIYPKIV